MAEEYSCVVGIGALFDRVLLERCSKAGHGGKGGREASEAGKAWVQHGASSEAELGMEVVNNLLESASASQVKKMALTECMWDFEKRLDMQQFRFHFPGSWFHISHSPVKCYCCYSGQIQWLDVPATGVPLLHPLEDCKSLSSCNIPRSAD